MIAFFHILSGTGRWYSDAFVDLIVVFDIVFILWMIRTFLPTLNRNLKNYYREAYEEELKKRGKRDQA